MASYFRQNARFDELVSRLRLLFGIGCPKCGASSELSWRDKDGKKLHYCFDCWPGYESCANPGCHHYECEHAYGGTSVITYVKPGMETVLGFKAGDEVQDPVGCLNAGCNCLGFRTKEEQALINQDFDQSRREAYWELSQLDGVADVNSEVESCVVVRTYMNNPTKEQREAVFNEQARLMQKYPKVVFDFNITPFDLDTNPVEPSINDHEQSTD